MSTENRELDITDDGLATAEAAYAALRDAIDLASDQDQMTWLTEGGKRIAAIVPAGMAEHLDGIVLLQEDPVIQQLFRRL